MDRILQCMRLVVDVILGLLNLLLWVIYSLILWCSNGTRYIQCLAILESTHLLSIDLNMKVAMKNGRSHVELAFESNARPRFMPECWLILHGALTRYSFSQCSTSTTHYYFTCSINTYSTPVWVSGRRKRWIAFWVVVRPPVCRCTAHWLVALVILRLCHFEIP